MTLVEIMVASAISGIVLTAVASLTIYSARSYAALANYVDLDQYSRKALDRMTSEIRQAAALTSIATNQLRFNYVDATSGATNVLSYTYDSSARTLTRTNGTEVEVLLKECDQLTFAVFSHNTISNSFDQFATTNATEAKLVRINWICSRNILGRKVNTESVQSAKIVIRKQ